MNYTITIREEEYEKLRSITFSAPGLEGAAYLLCAASQTDNELRFLGREVIAVDESDYLDRKSDILSISSHSFTRVVKLAKRKNLSVFFVHSHPGGMLAYSDQDNREEPKLQEFISSRIPDRIHGSMILTESGIIGRIFNGTFKSVSRIRTIGSSFIFFDDSNNNNYPDKFFDRQVLAFGPSTQKLLSSLHVGIVGSGGTGSAIVEQLTRLGIGNLYIFDGDDFEESNVNRVYGSFSSDTGQSKVEIAKRNIKNINVNTYIHTYPQHILHEDTAKELRKCDVVFGCTDKQLPRAILVQLSLRYLIPVIDTGVIIDSDKGVIKDIVGRVTTLFAGEACLFCRKRITPEGIRLESLSDIERAALVKDGYAPELEGPAPSVIPFTSAIASFAISELLHRLTGYMGNQRNSSEILCFFDQSRLRTNRPEADPDCICGQRNIWGSGDCDPYLNTSWSS